MANDWCVATGVPMSLEQMQVYLREQYGVPIADRNPGIMLPFAKNRGRGVFVRDRYFVPNYSYTIFEY
jgi:hypothetical protein